MAAITLEQLEEERDRFADLIARFKAQANTTLLRIPEAEIELRPGERYAGAVLDADGKVMHHLVLLAETPGKKLNWDDAKLWAESVGGSLPTRQEHALLFANCKPHLETCWHWSSEAHESDASSAWYCTFGYGYQLSGLHKSYEGGAVAVRLILRSFDPLN